MCEVCAFFEDLESSIIATMSDFNLMLAIEGWKKVVASAASEDVKENATRVLDKLNSALATRGVGTSEHRKTAVM